MWGLAVSTASLQGSKSKAAMARRSHTESLLQLLFHACLLQFCNDCMDHMYPHLRKACRPPSGGDAQCFHKASNTRVHLKRWTLQRRIAVIYAEHEPLRQLEPACISLQPQLNDPVLVLETVDLQPEKCLRFADCYIYTTDCSQHGCTVV